MDKDPAGWLHPKSYRKSLSIQVGTSNQWHNKLISAPKRKLEREFE